jgi:hypothetical protein
MIKNIKQLILDTDKMIRLSVICTLIGSFCILLFLWRGFAPWSVGVGAFLGSPILVLAMVLYVFTVIGDLRRRGSL